MEEGNVFLKVKPNSAKLITQRAQSEISDKSLTMIFFLLINSASSEILWFEETSFVRGSGVAPDETPQHRVSLSAYGIDLHEVSIAEFERFRKEGWKTKDHWHPDSTTWRQQNPDGAGATNRRAGRENDHPVVAVTWFEADAYCRFKGGSLPTEAQWEQAACGQDSEGKKTRFPWGESEDVEAVWYSGGKYGHLQQVLTKAVRSAPPEQQGQGGLTHTVGNVWEWTADWYHNSTYLGDAKKDLTVNPKGPSTGTWKTLKGGSFMNLPSYCSCTHREPAKPNRVAYTVGFRCAYTKSGAQR